MAFGGFSAIGKGMRSLFQKRQEEERKSQEEGLNQKLDEFAKQIKKLGSRQDEMVMALEELTESLQDAKTAETEGASNPEGEISALLPAMIAAADYIEDFYSFAKDSGDAAVYEQAGRVWGALGRKYGDVGIIRVCDERVPAEAAYHRIVATEAAGEIFAPGTIVKTLRSGYIYKGRVVRRSEVVAAKP